MKKMKLWIPLMLILFFMHGNAFAKSVEQVAKEALNAYKTKNVNLLKSHVVGVYKMLINDAYFDKRSVRKYMDAIEKWDGTLKEIRYQGGDVAGMGIQTAMAYFADYPENKDKIYAIALSSKDQKNWMLVGDGLTTESREAFNTFSSDLADTKMEKKEEPKIRKDFSIEMANGETVQKVTEEKIQKGINSLNDDNFFMILKSKENFIQVAFSEKGYDIQYKENGKQYVARDYLKQNQAIDAFICYFHGDNKWKKLTAWDSM